MDNQKIIDGMKKLREAIGDFIDNMAIDDADEEIKAKSRKPKKEEPEKPGKEDDGEDD
jgi:hypothetical protein